VAAGGGEAQLQSGWSGGGGRLSLQINKEILPNIFLECSSFGAFFLRMSTQERNGEERRRGEEETVQEERKQYKRRGEETKHYKKRGGGEETKQYKRRGGGVCLCVYPHKG